MATKDAHLADVLCHCPTAPDGHPLSTEGCQAEVKAGTYTPPTSDLNSAAAGIYKTLAAQTTGPTRARLLRRAATTRAAEQEHRAQDRCRAAHERVRRTTEEAGYSPTKRQAEQLLKAREALPVQLESARQLRWQNLGTA